MNLTKGEIFLWVVGILALLAILGGVTSCTYALQIDGRERKQSKIDHCMAEGYGGMIELSDGRSFVCSGGSTDERN